MSELAAAFRAWGDAHPVLLYVFSLITGAYATALVILPWWMMAKDGEVNRMKKQIESLSVQVETLRRQLLK